MNSKFNINILELSDLKMMNRNSKLAFEERMPHTISPSSSMLRLGSQAGDTRVSYCKLPGHERDEIEGACY